MSLPSVLEKVSLLCEKLLKIDEMAEARRYKLPRAERESCVCPHSLHRYGISRKEKVLPSSQRRRREEEKAKLIEREMEDSSSYLLNIDSAVEHHVGKSGVKVFHSSNLFVNLDVAKSCILSYTQEICVVVSAQQL